VIGNAAITNIYNTQSGAGGGIGFAPVSAGYGLITHCLIASNISSSHGGGISLAPGDILANGLVANCTIRGNAGLYGGGVIMTKGALRNCLVFGNTASRGGGVHMTGAHTGDKMLQNCTVVGNTNTSYGAGGVSLLNGANPYFQNCIIWNNRSLIASSNVSIEANSTAVSFSNCCTAGDALVAAALVNQYSANNLSVDPGLAGYRLGKGSLCIDTGVVQPWMNEAAGVDLDGRPRRDRFTRKVDMGCYEYVPTGMMISFW
jgi:hypothetical protein